MVKRQSYIYIIRAESKIITAINPCFAELFVAIFHHLKLELLTQFPASNNEKYYYLWKINIWKPKLFD